MTQNIWIAADAQEKIDRFKAAAKEDFFILTDFDRTLTAAYRHGSPGTALISQVYSQDILPAKYKAESEALFEKYYPMEMNPNLDEATKTKAMEEWWEKCFEIFVRAQLKQTEVRYAMEKTDVWLRAKCPQLLKLTHEENIPVIILSANGLGWRSIKMFLENKELDFPNIKIISNRLVWDDNNVMVGFMKPIIHTTNKHFSLIPERIRADLAAKKWCLLLGDTLEDVNMASGLPEGIDLLKVGFYNQKTDEALSAYQGRYDVLILGDGTMDWVVEAVGR
jgi:5'-nucleotidase